MSMTLYCATEDADGQPLVLLNAPKVNMSNSRGEAVLRLLGLNPVARGRVDHRQLVIMIPACWQALNSPTKLRAECIKPLLLKGKGGATMHVGGVDVEYLQHRLHAVLDLLKHAQQNNHNVVWA